MQLSINLNINEKEIRIIANLYCTDQMTQWSCRTYKDYQHSQNRLEGLNINIKKTKFKIITINLNAFEGSQSTWNMNMMAKVEKLLTENQLTKTEGNKWEIMWKPCVNPILIWMNKKLFSHHLKESISPLKGDRLNVTFHLLLSFTWTKYWCYWRMLSDICRKKAL